VKTCAIGIITLKMNNDQPTIDLNMLRDHLLDRTKTLQLMKTFINFSFKDRDDNDVNKVLRHWSEVNLETNISRIFNYSESPIEKIFFNAVNLTAFLKYPFSIVFTPRFDSALETIQSFRARDRDVIEILNRFESIHGGQGHREFLEWIDSLNEMTSEEKITVKTHVIMYHDLKLKDAFHISIQASLKGVVDSGSRIRPDMLIWIPSDPNFKLIVECDGFKYHSDKASFTRDRARDRSLQQSGFQVLRFSGTEIYQNPIGISFQLCDFLFSEYELRSNNSLKPDAG